MADSSVTIDIVSDVMCPWCYIGKKRLETALQEIGDAIEVSVRWRPYQLDSTLPPEGKNRKQYLEDKFGGPERASQIYGQIEDAGKAEGIPFAFDKIEVSPNTLDAHRLIRWSQSAGDGVQDRLVEILFKDFFLCGKNIGDHAVLIEAASQAGMDGEIVADLLKSEKDSQEVVAEIGQAVSMGVQGVPCFIIDGKYAIPGAQDPATLETAIRQVASGNPETA